MSNILKGRGQRLKILMKKTLSHHQKSVNDLAISPDGTCILSGADDACVVVWNVDTGEKMQVVDCAFFGPVNCVTWLDLDDGDCSRFVFGCADGTLHMYGRSGRQSPFKYVSMTRAHPGAVEALAFDRVFGRLASVGCGSDPGSGTVQLWKLATDAQLEPLVSSPPQKRSTVKSVSFCDGGASVVVYFLESHTVVCYSVEPWSLKWSRPLPTRIGHATLVDDVGPLLVYNLATGVDQYTFPALERMQSFPQMISRNLPMQVSAIPGIECMVVGGDDGFARVFDQRTGQLVDCIHHAEAGIPIQAVSVFSTDDSRFIATASSTPGHPDAKCSCDVKIWSLETSAISSPAATRRLKPRERAPSNGLGWQLIVLYLGLFITILLQILSFFPNKPTFSTITEALSSMQAQEGVA